jgi:deleted in liver cancer protein
MYKYNIVFHVFFFLFLYKLLLMCVDKRVFGVPFSIILQKTGHTLPKGIQAALTWLKINALDQTGIFRKSGVKSRIAKLKASIDQTEEDIIKIFEDQQAYDVADVVKQYFRDLPESLLTTKLSETFVAIFQYVPNDIKFEALQSAILLLPDEHREVLLMLLEFLAQVADNAEHNQMSASNLSLCLAPSIFQNGVHSNTPNASPRRKKPTGLPDAKDLDENRASTECLTYMILNYKRIYQINSDKMNRCNFSYMEESRPVTLEALGDTVQLSNWRSYLYECVKATVKEGREKSRGWMTVNSHDPNIEIFCRKVGDGHPLKLWKCTTEIEATPMMILNRITKERHLWDKQLLKMRVIESLDANSDIFQYACSSGHTATDYCVLR